MKAKKIVTRCIVGILVVVILVVILMVVGILNIPAFLVSESDDDDTLKQAVQIIQDYPTDIMIYGDDISFEYDITYRKITSLEESSLARDSSYDYSFLIINDRSDQVELTSEEISLIYDYIYTKGYSVVYLGEKYLSAWDDSQYIANVEGGAGVAFINEDGNVIRNVGFWTDREEEMMQDDYPSLLGEVLLYQIEDFIRANN